MGKIGKSSSLRLRPYAVLISYFCGHVGRATRAARSTENGRIRHIPTSPAHASAARNSRGVTPISRRKGCCLHDALGLCHEQRLAMGLWSRLGLRLLGILGPEHDAHRRGLPNPHSRGPRMASCGSSAISWGLCCGPSRPSRCSRLRDPSPWFPDHSLIEHFLDLSQRVGAVLFAMVTTEDGFVAAYHARARARG
jgi:hypothetical protein